MFNHAYQHSLIYDAGDPLPQGRLSQSLQAVTSVNNNSTAGRYIQRAVQEDNLQETNEGYAINSEGPTTGEIRQSLESKLREVMQNGENCVIESPTSSGKTYTPSTTRWRDLPEITGNQPVILLSGTTEARDNAVTNSENSWVTAEVLYGRDDCCPLAGGEYDSDGEKPAVITAPDGSEPSEWFKTMCEDHGLHFSVAHSLFEHEYDSELPCSEGDTVCPGVTQWQDIPQNKNGEFRYDVLHATHPFVQVPELIKNCNVIIDEQPDFSLDLNTGRMREAISSYLSEIDAPLKTWEDLIVRKTGNQDLDQTTWENRLEKPDADWFQNNRDAHALAPGITEAIVTAEKRNHERWVGSVDYTYPTLDPQHDGPNQDITVRIVFEGGDSNSLNLIQAIPDLSQARCVIGLDAHPTMPKWRGNTNLEMEKKQIVTTDDRQKWRRNQRNLRLIQIGENKNTWTKSGFSDAKVKALCQELRWRYGSKFRTGITSKRFEGEFKRLLREVGVESPKTMHFGNEKSVDDFGAEEFGIVAGCISPSDEQIKDWMALLNKNAKPEREVSDGYSGGQIWVGRDEDVAHDLIKDVRERGILQACGRYARSPQDPNDQATVYVLTDVLPDLYVDEKKPDVQPLAPKQEQILDYVSSCDGTTVREIHEEMDINRKHIYATLNDYSELSWIQVHEDAGAYNRDVFEANRNPAGIVSI